MPQIALTSRCALSCAVVASALACLPLAVQAEEAWADVKKAGVLKCGAAVAAPYVIRDAASGEYSGVHVELCRDFGEKELGVKVEFVNTNWDNLVAGLQSGSWDMALALNETEERKRAVHFSAPAMYYQISLVVDKNNAKFAQAGNSVADYDLQNTKFSVMSGTQQDRVISKMVKNAQVQRLPGMDETRLALISKRVDVLVDASDTNQLFVAANPEWAKEIIPEPPLAKTPCSFGLNKKRSQVDIQYLNDYIERRRAVGDIDKMIHEAVQQAVAIAKRDA